MAFWPGRLAGCPLPGPWHPPLSLCGACPLPGLWARGTGGLHPGCLLTPEASEDVGGPVDVFLSTTFQKQVLAASGARWPFAHVLPFIFIFSSQVLSFSLSFFFLNKIIWGCDFSFPEKSQERHTDSADAFPLFAGSHGSLSVCWLLFLFFCFWPLSLSAHFFLNCSRYMPLYLPTLQCSSLLNRDALNHIIKIRK